MQHSQFHLLKEEIAEYKEHIEGYKELVNKLKTTNAELEKQYYEALAKIAKENGEDFVLENNTKNITLESKPKQFKKSNPTIIKPVRGKKITSNIPKQGQQYQKILNEIDNIDEGYVSDKEHEI